MSGRLNDLLERRELRDLPLARRRMRDRIAALGVPDRIVSAMDAVPRHAFVPGAWWRLAYAEPGLWLPSGAFLPAPEATARILAGLDPSETSRILELGTGTGYLTALLGLMCESVLTIDTIDLTDGVLAAANLPAVRQAITTGETIWRSEPAFDALLTLAPISGPPSILLDHARRLVFVSGLAGGPQRLLLARPDGAGGASRVDDLGPLIVPSPDMARAVTTGGVIGVPAGGGNLEGGA